MNKVDEYIESFAPSTVEILTRVRAEILKRAPGAEEYFAYGMPAYRTNGRVLVYFAGYRNHVGLYALPSAHDSFRDELSAYKHGKGSVQFPLNKPIPYDLIGRIVEFRVAENSLKSK